MMAGDLGPAAIMAHLGLGLGLAKPNQSRQGKEEDRPKQEQNRAKLFPADSRHRVIVIEDLEGRQLLF